MSSEESNKTLKKTPSQDSNSDIKWEMDDMYDAFRDAAKEYDRLTKDGISH